MENPRKGSGRQLALRRGKGPVAAVPGAAAVGRYDSEMISSVRSQAADVASDVPVRVSSLTLDRRGVSITGGGPILKMNVRG